MAENLLQPSGIKLYGRIIDDLALKPGKLGKPLGGNRFLYEQLSAKDATLARIYGFSFEGQYYALMAPAVMLVHGEGKPANPDPSNKSTGPGTTDQSGVAAKGFEFTTDTMYWEYDKGDFSLRIEIEAGPLEQILLAAEVESDAALSMSGSKVQYSGSKVQYSGSKVQYSGSKVRLRGRGD